MAVDMADEPEVDIDALSDEDAGKIRRGEASPPVARSAEKIAEEDDLEADPKAETVPHGKFHRVNERRKQAEERAAALERAHFAAEQRADLATRRMTELMEAAKPPPEEEPEPDLGPDPEEDAIGSIKWMRAQKAAEIQNQKEWQAQQGQRSQVERIFNDQTERFQAVKAEHPVLQEAYNELLQSWGRELAMQGVQGPELQRRVNRLEVQWATWAHQNRRPIEDVIWELAQSRGWRPAAAEVDGEKTDQQPRDANGQFAKASAEMDKREQTKLAAKSLGGSGGPAETGEITPQTVIDMSEEEFAAFKKRWGDNAMKKAMGYLQ